MFISIKENHFLNSAVIFKLLCKSLPRNYPSSRVTGINDNDSWLVNKTNILVTIFK